jgi:Protein of unknown function DUF262
MSELKTCFKKVDYDLGGLLHYIDIGDIALPDIQRPFVWSNAKVRDLFDSMYRGFPVGYFLFWENVTAGGTKQIGVGGKQHHVPRLLIVDGQQRLTSLFAVFRGRKVLDEDYKERQIEVAFRPRDGKFEVADVAIRRDPEWISNISTIWASGKPSYQMVKGFLKQLETKGPVSETDEELISHNLDRLFDLQKNPFTALEIAASVDEEQVADNRLKEVKDAEGFASTLEGIMANELTNDFWTVTLPANLDSSSARNPELFAYIAAQNRLGSPVLFSHKKISDLLDPALKTKKKPLERHHLFPRAWLERAGIDDLKRINQLANFALLEWPDTFSVTMTS